MMQIIYSFIYWWILRLFVHPCDDGQGLMPNGPAWIPVCTTSYPPGHLYICKSTTKAEHASKSWGFCSKSLWLCIGPEKSLRTRKGNYFCWDLTLSPIAVWLLVHLCWAHPPNINSRELWVLSSPDNQWPVSSWCIAFSSPRKEWLLFIDSFYFQLFSYNFEPL